MLVAGNAFVRGRAGVDTSKQGQSCGRPGIKEEIRRCLPETRTGPVGDLSLCMYGLYSRKVHS